MLRIVTRNVAGLPICTSRGANFWIANCGLCTPSSRESPGWPTPSPSTATSRGRSMAGVPKLLRSGVPKLFRVTVGGARFSRFIATGPRFSRLAPGCPKLSRLGAAADIGLAGIADGSVRSRGGSCMSGGETAGRLVPAGAAYRPPGRPACHREMPTRQIVHCSARPTRQRSTPVPPPPSPRRSTAAHNGMARSGSLRGGGSLPAGALPVVFPASAEPAVAAGGSRRF